MKKRYFFIIMLLMFLFSDCKKENSNITNIEQELIDEIHKRGLPSVAVCIVNNNQISWEWIYGHANLKEQIVADRETIYNFMSISKVFIAVSVMQLVENEKLKLDDDINKYLPYVVRNPKYPDIPISVRMLLTHTSGIAHPDGETWDYEIYYLYHGDDMPRISEWVPQYILPGGTAYRNNVWKDFKPG